MTFEPELFRPIESKEDAWFEKAVYDYEFDASYEYLQEEIAQAFAGRSVESARTYLASWIARFDAGRHSVAVRPQLRCLRAGTRESRQPSLQRRSNGPFGAS